jgi:Domain of unknown function (DUF4440)
MNKNQTHHVFLLALTSVAGVLCATARAGADESSTVAKEIARLENVYSQTFVTGDSRTADRILADDYIGMMGPEGKRYDKAAMLAEVNSLPHQASAKITSVLVRPHGDTALAFGTEDDTDPGSKIVAHRVWLDTWKRTAAGWRMVASSEITRKP